MAFSSEVKCMTSQWLNLSRSIFQKLETVSVQMKTKTVFLRTIIYIRDNPKRMWSHTLLIFLFKVKKNRNYIFLGRSTIVILASNCCIWNRLLFLYKAKYDRDSYNNKTQRRLHPKINRDSTITQPIQRPMRWWYCENALHFFSHW